MIKMVIEVAKEGPGMVGIGGLTLSLVWWLVPAMALTDPMPGSYPLPGPLPLWPCDSL